MIELTDEQARFFRELNTRLLRPLTAQQVSDMVARARAIAQAGQSPATCRGQQ